MGVSERTIYAWIKRGDRYLAPSASYRVPPNKPYRPQPDRSKYHRVTRVQQSDSERHVRSTLLRLWVRR